MIQNKTRLRSSFKWIDPGINSLNRLRFYNRVTIILGAIRKMDKLMGGNLNRGILLKQLQKRQARF